MLNWVELDAAALRWNLGQFRSRLAEGAELGAVVKSNAYGHGMLEVAGLATSAGADWLCVNNLDEGVALRQAGQTGPVLVMGYVPLDSLEAVVRHDLRPVVYNLPTLKRLDRLAGEAGKRVPVHLKVETGTHRQGIAEAEVTAFAEEVRGSTSLDLEGIGTHFANIEDTTNHSFADGQLNAYRRIEAGLRGAGFELPIRHTACSAATLLLSQTHYDLVRVGISLYGLWPSKETYVSCLETGKPAVELRPTLTWKSRVAQVKRVPEGSYVGYGCVYRATRDSRIAILPVGYHEGYDRGLSGTAHVLIHGRRAPVRGRICMNMCMVDVTDIPGVELEDEVVLLGAQGDERVSAEQLAGWAGTISYEILARIHPGLPRVVVE